MSMARGYKLDIIIPVTLDCLAMRGCCMRLRVAQLAKIFSI